MMKKEIFKPIRKLAALLLVSVLGCFLWAFSVPEGHAVTTVTDYHTQQGTSAQASQPTDTVSRIANLLGSRLAGIISLQNNEFPEIIFDERDSKNQKIVVDAYHATINKYQLPPRPPRPLRSSALVIIDGVEGISLDDIRPEQIESFSVLKDSTAVEIYGEKAVNGVVIVTTKQANK